MTSNQLTEATTNRSWRSKLEVKTGRWWDNCHLSTGAGFLQYYLPILESFHLANTTVDGSEIRRALFIYKVWAPSQMDIWDFWTINSNSFNVYDMSSEMILNVLWLSNLNHLPSDVFNFILSLSHNHNHTIYPRVLRTGGWQGRVFEVCLVLGWFWLLTP